MFYQCTSLKGLDISHFNMDNVIKTEEMLVGCTLKDYDNSKLKLLIEKGKNNSCICF